MEPVAHFGLGEHKPEKLTVIWPDGCDFTMDVNEQDMKGTLHIQHENAEVKKMVFGRHDTELVDKFHPENNTLNVTLNITKPKHTEL